MGLGLAITRALVDLHGGSIRAESEGDGKGATFIIELPGEQPAFASVPPSSEVEQGASRRLRLLVVEDHHDTARTLRTLLKRSGYSVDTAGSIAAALDLAVRETFDLLISDLGLPDGSGYELMTALQRIQPVPGIAMSGYGMEEDVRRSRDAGFHEHLVKPIDMPRLQAAIRKLMETRS
jgi:two-component system CheB/CheR fusion protein